MITGAITALITPFKDGRVDFPSLEKIIEFQIDAGIDGIAPCGTTGESPTLSHDEHREVIQFTIKQVAGRVKVIAGTGSNATQEAIALSVDAEKSGADGLLLVSPYYNKPTQEGLFYHYQAVAESVSIECVLYNVPGRTNVVIDQDTLKRLTGIKNINTIKDAVGDIDFTSETLRHLGESTSILSGNDSMNFPILCLGGKGAISVLSNLFPKEVKAMMSMVDDGEWGAAKALHFKLLDLAQGLFWETNPIPVKASAHAMGLIETNELRLPLTPMTEQKWLDLKKVLDELNEG